MALACAMVGAALLLTLLVRGGVGALAVASDGAVTRLEARDDDGDGAVSSFPVGSPFPGFSLTLLDNSTFTYDNTDVTVTPLLVVAVNADDPWIREDAGFFLFIHARAEREKERERENKPAVRSSRTRKESSSVRECVRVESPKRTGWMLLDGSSLRMFAEQAPSETTILFVGYGASGRVAVPETLRENETDAALIIYVRQRGFVRDTATTARRRRRRGAGVAARAPRFRGLEEERAPAMCERNERERELACRFRRVRARAQARGRAAAAEYFAVVGHAGVCADAARAGVRVFGHFARAAALAQRAVRVGDRLGVGR